MDTARDQDGVTSDRLAARGALVVVALAVLLNPLNTTMIAVVTGSVQRDLGVGTRAATSLLSAFAITSAIGHPLAGHAVDRVGARRVLLIGLVVVAAASLAASFAPTFKSLIIFRALQALGTSAGYPAGLAVLRSMSPSKRAVPSSWLGLISAASGTAATIGPTLGGALVRASGWRATFLVSVPLALLCAALGRRYIGRERNQTASGSGMGTLDMLPAQDLRRIVSNRAFISICIRFALFNLVFYTLFFGLPLWLEQVRELNPLVVGLVMAPIMGASVLSAPVAARIVLSKGPRAANVIAGVGFVVCASVLLGVDEKTPTVLVAASAALAGLPNVISNVGLQSAMTVAVPAQAIGVAAGILQTARFVGAAAAASVLALVFGQGATTSRLHIIAAIAACVAMAPALTRFDAKKEGSI